MSLSLKTLQEQTIMDGFRATDTGRTPAAQKKSVFFVHYLICCEFALNQERAGRAG